jgi:hypothetical protein
MVEVKLYSYQPFFLQNRGRLVDIKRPEDEDAGTVSPPISVTRPQSPVQEKPSIKAATPALIQAKKLEDLVQRKTDLVPTKEEREKNEWKFLSSTKRHGTLEGGTPLRDER